MTDTRAASGLLATFASFDPEALLAAPPDLIDFLPLAICACDAVGRICWFNARAAAIWGRSPDTGERAERYCGSHRLYGLDGALIAQSETPMAYALRTGQGVDGRTAVVERPDGSRVTAMVHIAPLFDAGGAVAGAINCFHDVSVQLDEDHSARESERKLRDGHRKEAETRQRLLFAELNHRIKNNMQTLYALLAAARRETGSEDARTALDEATRRVGAMAAAQTALYQSDDLSRFDSAAFMTSVCAAAAAACGDSLALHLHTRAGMLANDDAVPLALILNELIANAAKYGAGAGGRSEVAVCLVEEEGAFTLVVEDEGPGFELAEVRRRSSGLGLVIGLARQMGGRFRVERAPGARCILEFPGPPFPRH